MPKVLKNEAPLQNSKRKYSARTPEAKENHLISLAVDLAEKQLMEGTASSQVITHFLKLATIKEKLENEKLRADLKLAEAKVKSINSQEEIKELYENAMKAMKIYSGGRDEGFEDEDY